jgi:hypothetical protein
MELDATHWTPFNTEMRNVLDFNLTRHIFTYGRGVVRNVETHGLQPVFCWQYIKVPNSPAEQN